MSSKYRHKYLISTVENLLATIAANVICCYQICLGVNGICCGCFHHQILANMLKSRIRILTNGKVHLIQQHQPPPLPRHLPSLVIILVVIKRLVSKAYFAGLFRLSRCHRKSYQKIVDSFSPPFRLLLPLIHSSYLEP